MTVFESAMRSFREGFSEGWAMWCSPFVALAKHFRAAISAKTHGEVHTRRHA